MKIAIAGTCELAQHIAQSCLEEGYNVIILTRQTHPKLPPIFIPHVVTTTYTLPSVASALALTDTVISTITSPTIQHTLINACLLNRVRRFAPAEFCAPPSIRPLHDSTVADKLTILHRLKEEKHRLDSTVFSCGVLYERIYGDKNFLLDVEKRMVHYRVHHCVNGQSMKNGDEETVFCATAAKDVGKLVAKAVGMREWPPEMRMVGERMTVEGMVRVLEDVYDCTWETGREVRDLEELQEIGFEMEGEAGKRVEAAVGVRRGEWGWDEVGEGPGWVDLGRVFEGVGMAGFREWLEDKIGDASKR